MKLLISLDMEGVTGLTDPEDVLRYGDDFERGRRLMTGYANAAIGGAYDAGAEEVVGNDSHWAQRNVLLEQLDPRASLIRGFDKPMGMLAGIEGADAVAFVGYHSRRGTEAGVLSETLIGKELENLYLDGVPIGEI